MRMRGQHFLRTLSGFAVLLAKEPNNLQLKLEDWGCELKIRIRVG